MEAIDKWVVICQNSTGITLVRYSDKGREAMMITINGITRTVKGY